MKRQRLGRLCAAILALWWLPTAAWAHGIGGRQDLPVPIEFFVVGATLVLVISFVALSLLWPQPRLQELGEPRRLPSGWVRPARVVGGLLGVVLLFMVIVTGFVGAANPARNPGPVIVFVVFWLVVPFLSGLIGDIYPLIDPWRRLTTWLVVGEHDDDRLEAKWGYLPAAAVFIAFTWLELVAPEGGPRNLAIAALLYTGYLIAAAGLAGRNEMSRSFDGFAVYNHALGGIGPLRIGQDTVIWRGWLRGLPQLEPRKGFVVFVVLMIGTVSFDGVSGSLWWEETIATWTRAEFPNWLGWSRATVDVVVGTMSLIVVSAAIGGAYWIACSVAARIGGLPHSPGSVATRFAHTLIPIAFAYAVAHYFTLIVFEGQLLISTVSDPLGVGWDLFGTAGRSIDYTLIGPTAVWYVQVAVIVTGHVGGVVLAHDRALSDFRAEKAVRSQYAMLGLMVVLTGLGLTILAAG